MARKAASRSSGASAGAAAVRVGTVVPVAALAPDPNNRRSHPARNVEMITAALRDVGAARSIVIDEHDTVHAGNGVLAAAPGAGITHVRIVEADGDELIAVRRRGLTDEQKRRLAIYDNRTGELAEWNPEQMRLDAAAGLDLQPWFTDEEAAAIMRERPSGDVWEQALRLPSGEKLPLQQMTFVFSDTQAAVVKAALDAAKQRGGPPDPVNQNSNGTALAWVCTAFLGGGQ